MADQIQEGDVVQLKSGGPRMTVNHIQQDTGSVECRFFDGTEPNFLEVQIHSLEKIE